MKIDYLNLKQLNAPYEAEISKAIQEVLNSGYYLLGEQNQRFERAYAQYIGTNHCLSCGNGLEALTLIFRAYKELGILKEGDEIIVPANTYIASILSISENGLTPILMEPHFQTLQLDDSLIEEKITPRTKAILLVHLYGKCAYTKRMEEICHRHHLLLFEDNAQAHGCLYDKDKRTGSLGDAAAHSFYPGKNLGALGDAGAITTDNTELFEVVKAIANYGSSQKYVFDYKGINSRMDEMQAAALTVKLQYLDNENKRRQAIAKRYCEEIQHSRIILPYQKEKISTDNVFHIFPILCPERDRLQAYLKEKGIGTLIHYPIPPHKQRAYKEWAALSLPITEQIHQQELSLPCNSTLIKEQVDYIIKTINEFQ